MTATAGLTPANLRVLLIEDDWRDAQFVTHMLERMRQYKAHVKLAATIEEALARIDSDDFDVIVADFLINGQSSDKVVRASGGRLCGVPVIQISSLAASSIRELSYEAGAAHFINKADLTPGVLDGAVSTALYSARIEAALSRKRGAAAAGDGARPAARRRRNGQPADIGAMLAEAARQVADRAANAGVTVRAGRMDVPVPVAAAHASPLLAGLVDLMEICVDRTRAGGAVSTVCEFEHGALLVTFEAMGGRLREADIYSADTVASGHEAGRITRVEGMLGELGCDLWLDGGHDRFEITVAVPRSTLAS